MPESEALHFEALPDAQREIWPLLAPVTRMGFVLYGGTALALRFGHRVSVDFDFFTNEKISRNDLLELLPWLQEWEPTQSEETRFAYSFISRFGARATFLGGFASGRVGNPCIEDGTGIQIASADDIFAMKLAAIHGRAASKDYQDIAEILRRGYRLQDAIAGANLLIKNMLPPQFTLRALCYFDDVDISEEDKTTIVNACKQFDKFDVGDICLASDKLCAT